MARTLLLVGTRKGLFALESDEARAKWEVRGPYCEGWPVYHAIHDACTEIVGNEGRFEFLQEGRIRRTAKQPIQGPTNDIAGFGEPATQPLQPSHKSTRDVSDSPAGCS